MNIIYLRFFILIILIQFTVVSCTKVDVDYSASNFNDLKYKMIAENSSNSDIKLYRNQTFTIDYRHKDKMKNDLNIKMEYSLIDNPQIAVDQVITDYKTESVLSNADQVLKFSLKVKETLPSHQYFNLKVRLFVDDNSVEFVPSELVIKIDNSTTVPPAVVITSPPSNSYINISNQSNFQLNGSCESGNTIEMSSSSPQTLVVFPSPITCAGGEFSTGNMDLSGFLDGNISIDFKQKNILGESSSITSFSLIKDTVIPVLSVINPAESATVDTSSVSTFSFSGTCSEAGKAVIITGDITPMVAPVCSGSSWTTVLDTVGLVDGAFTLNVKIIDEAGNESLLVTRNLVKSSSGVVAVLSGHPLSITKLSTFSFTVSGADITHYKYALAKSITCASATYSNLIAVGNPITYSTVAGTGVFRASPGLLDNDGVYRLCVIGKNSVGTYQDVGSATSYTWELDQTIPAIPTVTTPVVGTNFNSSSDLSAVVFSGTCETGATVTLSGMYFDLINTPSKNVTCSANNWAAAYNISTNPDGNYTLVVNQTDVAGNGSGVQSVALTKDTVAPSLSSISHLGYSNSLSSTPVISWSTASDATSGVKKYYLAIGTSAGATDIKSWTDVGSATSYSFTSGISLNYGNKYYATLKVEDNAGNFSTALNSSGWWAVLPLVATPGNISVITGESILFNITQGLSSYSADPSSSGFLNTTTFNYSAPLNVSPSSETLTFRDSAGQSTTSNVTVRAFQNKDTYFHTETNGGYAKGTDIKKDSLGNLYVVGYETGSIGSAAWIVRKSLDGGSTWTTIDTYQKIIDRPSEANAIFIDSSDNIFVAGYAKGGVSLEPIWTVRKSTNYGVTWSTITEFQLEAGYGSVAKDIVVDSVGNVFTVGYGYSTAYGANSLIVHKSDLSGGNPSVKQQYQLSAGLDSEATGIEVDSTGAIYVVGKGRSASAHWIVLKSSNFGDFWTVVDDFQQQGGYDSSANAVYVDANNYIHVVGYGFDSYGRRWIVRKSMDGGGSWVIKDIHQKSIMNPSEAFAITSDGTGNLYAVGYSQQSLNTYYTVRRSEDAGETWADSESTYYLASTRFASGFGVLASGSTVIAVGVGTDANSISRMLIRKSIDSGVSWATAVVYGPTIRFSNFLNALSARYSTVYSSGSGGSGYSSSYWITRKSTDGSSWIPSDSYQLSAGKSASANNLCELSASEVFAAGYAEDAATDKHWIVRKFNGTAWAISDDFVLEGNLSSAANAIESDLSNTIYAVGYGADSTSASKWLVRKSSDSGVTWSTVENYNYNSSHIAEAKAVSVVSSSSALVGGFVQKTDNSNYWTIRGTFDGGVSWSEMDSFQHTNAKDAQVNALVKDSLGVFYAGGFAEDGSGVKHWIVKKSTDGGVNWSVVDNFLLDGPYNTELQALTTDALNNVYASGYGSNSSGEKFWILKKSANGGASWTVIDKRSTGSLFDVKSRALSTCLTNRICSGLSESVDRLLGATWKTRILSSP